MTSKAIALLAMVAVLLGGANAECPNQCSGHGRCSNNAMSFSTATSTVPRIQLPTGGTYSQYGWDTANVKKDSCTCFTRLEEGNTVYAWQGADCSERTCPYGKSWDAAPHANDAHDIQAECSGRGLCDRNTGTCECFPGYEGKGCRRMSCPNDCSGHGRCKTLHEIAKLRSENTNWSPFTEFDYASVVYDSAWDAHKVQGCECDEGFKGADCSLVECPSGTDPMGGPGATSGRECSGRGICDYGSGVCSCFETYGGDKCEIQKQSYL
ncbi:Tenascin [Hondaea fermentalgiana]|uniref:Tenascin n=1 Tax=Hondaea fermentalgiana TaxID=2315210 RepID=A0A2R5GQ87_9STRA|nr:Tenascin [Hondaea fermentalgiana]|eukprot:GBG33027.1 Tenascin [Hondaea fermentalgiana]